MKKRRAFTLLEILMTLAIASLVTVLALVNVTRGQDRAGAKGLASILEEELRRVRQEAIARRRPTAIVFPTNGGRASACRSYYVMEGEAEPRVVRSRNFLSEFNGADIFIGRWPLLSGSYAATDFDVAGSKWNMFSVNDWLPAGSPARSDNTFVFLPDGSVRTNGVPGFDNHYHIVVAAGVGYTPASSANANLTAAGECYTIRLSPIGGVSLTTGLFGQDGSVRVAGRQSSRITHQAEPVTTVTADDPEPVPGYPKILPIPVSPTKPADVDAVISKDQYVTLEMQATSPTGEQLFCNWKVITTTGKTSAFSMQSEGSGADEAGGRMEWDQSLRGGSGAWRAVWQWRPPTDALPGERYDLKCEVQNVDSGEKHVSIKKFEITPPGKILFESDRNGHAEVWTMDENGERERRYLGSAGAPAGAPSATLGGNRIVYEQNGNLILHTPLDPGNDIQLTTGGDCHLPAISPNGNFVAFFEGGKVRVMKCGAGATHRIVDVGDPVAFSGGHTFYWETVKIAWSPDGNELLFPSAGQLHYADIAVGPGGDPIVTPRGQGVTTIGGGQPVSSATYALDNRIFITNNYNLPNYDPWIFVSTGGALPTGSTRYYLSVGYEDSSVERNPRGEDKLLICRAAAGPPPGNRQLHIVTGTTVGPALTASGNNIHPVWTK